MKNVVVIPIYTLELNENERLSLQQCSRVLGTHDIVVIHPAGLDVEPLRPLLPMMRPEAFEDSFFAGIEGYNRLMLSTELYDRFSAYDYMLIYQTDAWVFADELDLWCARGYDYVGAPWIPRSHTKGPVYMMRCLYARCSGHSTGVLRQWKVGNGGFSLRRPALMARLLREHADEVPQSFSHIKFNEDVFWSCTMEPYLRIPQWREALAFSVEKEPAFALDCLGRMPFGCHGLGQPHFLTFWKAHIPELQPVGRQ